MEITSVIITCIVCGTLWDVVRRLLVGKDLQAQTNKLDERILALTTEVEALRTDLADASHQSLNTEKGLKDLSALLRSTAADWKQLFAEGEERNEQMRKEIYSKLGQTLSNLPRPGFNR